MESTILSINNVNKSFGGVITSKNVTFDAGIPHKSQGIRQIVRIP